MDERGIEVGVNHQLRLCELHVSGVLLGCFSKDDLHCKNSSAGAMSCRYVRFEAFFNLGVFAMIATQFTLQKCKAFDNVSS